MAELKLNIQNLPPHLLITHLSIANINNVKSHNSHNQKPFLEERESGVISL